MMPAVSTISETSVKATRLTRRNIPKDSPNMSQEFDQPIYQTRRRNINLSSGNREFVQMAPTSQSVLFSLWLLTYRRETIVSHEAQRNEKLTEKIETAFQYIQNYAYVLGIKLPSR
jgi:hypothetical protein